MRANDFVDWTATSIIIPPVWTNAAFAETDGRNNAEIVAEERDEPEKFIPRPLKSRRLEIEMLGEPPQDTCFGCVYFGERDTTIPVDRIRVLIEMQRQSFGRMNMATLAKHMAEYYETHIRIPINNRIRGEKPLPAWPASQILEHFRYHHHDPQVKQVVLLEETEELRTDLLACCFEQSTKTGQIRVNKHAIDAYDKMVKLQLFIQKQDPSKMVGYSSDARINPSIMNQGPISIQTKQLMDYLK